jgi:ABC-2 type transport system permease protein
MTALIRAELLQLRTLRSTYVVALGLIALVVGLTVADLTNIGKPMMDTAAELREPMAAGAGVIAAVFVAMLAASRIGGEYRYGTIAQRLLAAPVRDRMLAARVATYALVGAVVAAVVLGITAAVTVPMVSAEDRELFLSATDVLKLVGEVVLSGGLLAVLGVAVGFLTRSQSAAIMTVFGFFLGEKILGGALGDLSNFLPFSLMDSLIENHGAPLSPGVAAISLTVLVGVVTAAAGAAVRRRDVTA